MPKKSTRQTVCGEVVAHNISPRGDIEGVLMRLDDEVDGSFIQINFPKHQEAQCSIKLPIGEHTELLVEPEHEEGEHLVYVMSDNASQVEGEVVALNYARHGEVNGYRLADGTFVHVKPDGARRSKVEVGDRISASGSLRVGAQTPVLETLSIERLEGKPVRAKPGRGSTKKPTPRR